MDLWVVFLTGLTVGGLTCLAVQGGLLASTIAARGEQDLDNGKRGGHNLFPIAAFLISKLVAYIALGFLLGLFGQALAISGSVRVVMQFVAGAYMLVVAGNLLNIHPIFRYAVIQPPRFLTRMVRNESKSNDIFAPALLGAMTVFIPCGTTLAMEALAISSGNPFYGAAIMVAFTAGTVPLFFGVGFLTNKLGDGFKRNFYRLAGVALIYLGITTVNAALNLTGSQFTLENLAENFPLTVDLPGGISSPERSDSQITLLDGVQSADIKVFPTGYEPNRIQVKSGVPVRLNLTPIGGFGCTTGFVIPKLGINEDLSQKEVTTVEFTPKEKGNITWTCSMGMYRGVVEVI